MQNLKIKVGNESESKEAQELFHRLLGKENGFITMDNSIRWVVLYQGHVIQYDFLPSVELNEITLPELRDLVVLKRNDVNDATHESNFFKYVELADGWYYFDGDTNKWLKSSGAKPEYYEKLPRINMNILDTGRYEQAVKKEYLFKQIGGDYKLVGHDCQGRAIEIPEGAEQATICREFIAFWKNGATMFIGGDSEWDFNYDLDCSEYLRVSKDYGAKIIWQRATHPEELPFIDDWPNIKTATGHDLDIAGRSVYGARSRNKGETDASYRRYLIGFFAGEQFIDDEPNKISFMTPEQQGRFAKRAEKAAESFIELSKGLNIPESESLNDQYAEIEQVRQQTIEQTLAERGSRYGDFESVAETTRALMRTLADADRFDELSAAQYEALHMICSKMARIVNGDPDYPDNWHDIAGYAKLVEDTI